MALDMRNVINHPQFSGLNPEEQVGFLTQLLNKNYTSFSGLDEDEKRQFVEYQIREHQPRGAIESVLSGVAGFIPAVGPLAQRYLFDENIPAPSLLTGTGLVSQEESRERGAFYQAAADVGLGAAVAGAGIITSMFLPVTAPLIVTGGISALAVRAISKRFSGILAETIPAVIGRSAVMGSLFGAGELVLNPPETAQEAAFRLGASTAVIGGLGTGLHLAFSPGRRLSRAINREMGGGESFNNFKIKTSTGDLLSITDSEISAVEKALGNKTDKYANDTREGLREIVINRENLRQQKTLQDQEAVQSSAERGILESENLMKQMGEVRIQEALREADVVAQEQVSGLAGARMLQEQISREAAIMDAQPSVDEALRYKQVNSMLDALQNRRVERGELQLTRSEQQLVNQLDFLRERGAEYDVAGRPPIYFGLNNEVVTLPMGLIQDTPNGARAVIAEAVQGKRVKLRSMPDVSLDTLREPRTADEIKVLQDLLVEQNVKSAPQLDTLIDQLILRVDAEHRIRLAAEHAARPNANSTNVQRTIDEFRRESVMQNLRSYNALIEENTFSTLENTPLISAQRPVVSFDNISPKDAGPLGKALRASGYENVYLGLSPEGRVEILISNKPDIGQVGKLHINSTAHRGTFDPTTGDLYNNLSPAEHMQLGKAFGIPTKERELFNEFTEYYARELRDRGIRWPVTAEALGIPRIEDQIAGGRKTPLPINPGVIAQSPEDVRRILPGDFVTMPKAGNRSGFDTLYVGSREIDTQSGKFLYKLIPQESMNAVDITNPAMGQFIPLLENELTAFGVKRAIDFPIASTLQDRFNMESPAKNLQDLFGLRPGPELLKPVSATNAEIRNAAQGMGLRANVGSNQRVSISFAGGQISDLSLNEAAHFLNRARQMARDGVDLNKFFGNCLR